LHESELLKLLSKFPASLLHS